MKRKNVILVPPCTTYGDCLSVVGMIYYLLEHYEQVHFFIRPGHPKVYDYYHHFFMHDPRYGNSIFLTKWPYEELIQKSDFGSYDVVNIETGDWLSAKFDLKCDKIENYFNDLNPLYNVLNVAPEHQTNPNCHLPNRNVEINHLFYYKLVGLNNDVRMKYFHYARNEKAENDHTQRVLTQHGIGSGEKYNVVNCPQGNSIAIGNDYPIINIDMLAPCPGYLLSLVEGAETIHLVEGSNVNFLYHCQYVGIFKPKSEVNFIVRRRNRNWPQFNLDYAWKMMSTPILDGWNFIF